MATPSSILAGKIPWTEKPGSSMGRKESATTEHSEAHKEAEGGEGKKSGTVRSLQGR